MASADGGPMVDETAPAAADPGGPARPSRRGVLTGAGLFGAGTVAGGLTGYLTRPGSEPAALTDLPPLPNENLDPDYTGGDLCVQACSDDPLVAFHAVRNLARIGMGVAAHNWMELGFGRTSTTSTAQATPRNLLGFKDGTRNIKAEQTELLNQHVWVGQETDQPWLRGGSYMVTRKIRMFVENWDRDYLQDQD